ncbi:hypothetical protein vBPaeMUSP18_57 [Pseudomonas phage vB_PaeM_USP_18]|nr:hypothetical protein vBPaeMUSP18_57 [Pseudomonas phage vB_PaeM_USP_18]QLI49494.1 hypothetical protein vBPaeMUSP25_57 [Pseudomonas phage vB_PaeM_USP_25]
MPKIAENILAENEKLRGLLREFAGSYRARQPEELLSRTDAALSHQTEPECSWPTCECALDLDKCKVRQAEPATAQDEREAVEVVGWVDPENIERMKRRDLCGFMIEEREDSRRSCAVMTVAQHERIVASLTRPAQTGQQPEQSGLVEALEWIVSADWQSSETATDFAISQAKGFLIQKIKQRARDALSAQGGAK